MNISFKTARNLGLSLMVGILLLISGLSLFNTSKIIKNISIIQKENEPKAEKTKFIRERFLTARDLFIRFARKEEKEITLAIKNIDAAIEEGLLLKKIVSQEDIPLVDQVI